MKKKNQDRAEKQNISTLEKEVKEVQKLSEEYALQHSPVKFHCIQIYT